MERRGACFNWVTAGLFFVSLCWVILQFLAPLALPAHSVTDLSGLTAVSDNEEIIRDMPLPWNVVYRIGDRLCHQKAERSLFINGNQMPFCARCTGIWLGLIAGISLLLVYTFEINERFLGLVISGLIPIGIDGVGQLIGLWSSTQILRLFTGLIAGIVMGVALGVIIDEIQKFRNKKLTPS